MSVKSSISYIFPKKNAFGVFLVCFSIAAFFWLLKNLSASFTHVISVPIQLVNYPKGYIVYGPEHPTLQLTVKGRGFQLVQWSDWSADPFPIDLGRLVMNKSKKAGGYILMNDYNTAIRSYLDNELEWDGVLPDTLFVRVDRRIEKELTVRFNGSLSAENDSVVVHYELFPQKVLVSGPKTKLDSTTEISTIEAHFELLFNDISTELALTIPNCDSCLTKPNKVKLSISLEGLPSE